MCKRWASVFIFLPNPTLKASSRLLLDRWTSSPVGDVICLLF